MAKTQKEIVTALKTALEKGDGDLSSLDALLDRVKIDIVAAQAEEKARKAKEEAEEKARKEREEARLKARGEKIAAMATRVLNDEATAADVALVMESYMHSLGFDDAEISAKDVEEAKNTAEKAVGDFGDLLSAFGTLAEAFGDTGVKVKKTTTKRDPDDVLREFLKTIG